MSGRGIARGYRGRPELTAQRFVELRRPDLVSHRRSGPILARRHAGVRRPRRSPDQDQRLSRRTRRGRGRAAAGAREWRSAVAALVPTPGGADVLAAAVCPEAPTTPRLTAERIREALAELVPAHMIPQPLSLVERIPFTDGGKIDRACGRRPARRGASPSSPATRRRSTGRRERSWKRRCATSSRDVLGVTRRGRRATTTSSPSVAIRCWRPRPSPASGSGWTRRA